MKKILKILFIAFLFVLAILVAIPFVFKERVKNIVITEINKQLNAEVELNSIKLSVFRSFPDLSVNISELTVKGEKKFKDDTLLFIEHFYTTLDLKSVIKGEKIEIKKLLLERPYIFVKILENGDANYDIIGQSDDQTTTETENTTDTSQIKIGLTDFEIIDAYFTYIDMEGNMNVFAENLNMKIKGNLSESFTSLEIKSTIDSLTYQMDNINYLKKTKIDFDAVIDADLEKFLFTFKENVLKLNEFEVKFDGTIEMPQDDIDFDITFNAPTTKFKHILSLVPYVYMTDFEGLETDGNVKFNGFYKGTMTEKDYPLFGVSLSIANAMINYPDLPEKADQIAINAYIESPDSTMDNITIDIKKFHVEMAKNPIDLVLKIDMTADDMMLDGNLKVNVHLDKITQVVPIEDTELKGMFNCNISFEGKMSDIEKEYYQKFDLRGKTELTNFEYKSSDLPQGFNILNAQLDFSPKYVLLKTFDAISGESNFNLKGKVTKFIPYIFSDGTLSGTLTLKSNKINTNEFLTETNQEQTEQISDTTETAIFIVPKNINFLFTTKINHLIYDKLNITNIYGAIHLKNQQIDLNNLRMYLLDGSMIMNGKYSTKVTPKVDFDLKIYTFDISKTYEAFNTVAQLAPIAKHCSGNVSAQLNFNSQLDSTMNPIFKTLNSRGQLSTRNVSITNSKLFSQMAQKLSYTQLEQVNFRNLTINYEIRDGNLEVKPFNTKIGQSTTQIEGTQNLDKTIDFNINMQIPTISPLGKLFNNTEKQKLNLNINVTGTSDNPKVKLSTKDGTLKEQVKEEIKEKVSDFVAQAIKKGDILIAEAQKKAQKLISEAKSKGTILKQEAKTAGQKLTTQANKNATKIKAEADEVGNDMIKKAGNNPIAKKTAQKSAEKIKQEADTKAENVVKTAQNEAKKLENEADKNALKLESDAKKQGDSLINQAKIEKQKLIDQAKKK